MSKNDWGEKLLKKRKIFVRRFSFWNMLITFKVTLYIAKLRTHLSILVGVPLTQAYFLASPNGAIYSADHDINRFKPENVIKSRPETNIINLTQGGQDILHCGINSTVITGLLSAGHVLERDLISESEVLQAE